jgi:hypothetical protein
MDDIRGVDPRAGCVVTEGAVNDNYGIGVIKDDLIGRQQLTLFQPLDMERWSIRSLSPLRSSTRTKRV